VAASSPGDLILVDPGTYPESITLPHDLTVRSTYDPVLTIWSPPTGPAAHVPPGVAVTIDGFTMSASITGPVLEVDGGTLLLDATSVQSTTSSTCGAGLYAHDGADVTVTSSDFTDLHASGANGGGVCVTTGSTLTTTSTDFEDCTAVDGGGLYVSESSWTSSGDNIRGDIVSGRGGGLFAVDATIDLSSPAFDRCDADEGASVWLDGSYLYAYSNPTFNRGFATTRGGAICATDSSVVLDSPALQDNDSSGDAGGIAMVRGDLTSDNPSFKRCAALAGDGGSIHAIDATVSIVDGDLSDGSADSGGNVYISGGSLTLTGTVLKKGIATVDGGGIHATNAAVTVTGASFDDQSASGVGGGIYATGTSSVYLKACSFNGSLAASGGGVAAVGIATLSIDQVSMCGETATAGSGGGVFLDGIVGTVVLNRSSFVDSTATADGGAIYARGGALTVLNADVVGNAASRGGGIFTDSAALDMRNTAVVSTGSGSGVHGIGASTASFDYNLWFSNTPSALAGVFGPADHGAGAVFANPDYVLYDPLTCVNDFTPQGGSPLIDAGDPLILDDADGTRSDIGSQGGGPAAVGVDADGDGYVEGVDCDDGNPYVNPGATEVCGGGDEDCDTLIDDADPSLVGPSWFDDADLDGFGDPAAETIACAQPPGTVANQADCDDTDGTVNPTGTEVCGGGDEDCDGLVDDADPSVADATSWFDDTDLDGFGDAAAATLACAQPPGTVANQADCDDTDGTVHPNGTEVCGGGDEDCDGLVDGADPSVTDATSWFDDTDIDGFGDAAAETLACAQPPGTVANQADCDDTDGAVNPNGAEVCGGGDEDCDGLFDDADPSVVDATSWFDDTDLDGFGDPAAETLACAQPPGTVANQADCDDTDGMVNPYAAEVCGGGDEDCDGLVDDADPSVSGASWYADLDTDGYGDPSAETKACIQPPQTVADNTDCDDTRTAVNPGATEVCGGGDEDCDLLVDEADPSVSDGVTYWADTDSDGYGDAASPIVACTLPPDASDNALDCDDADPDTSPDGVEVCGGGDEDCDGDIDDADSSVTQTVTWLADDDNDGYGGAFVAAEACVGPAGSVVDGGDCDDTDDSVHPGATEICSGRDDDCDTLVDDADPDVSGAPAWYPDADADTYGDLSGLVEACLAPPEHVADATDCDDTRADVNPGAVERCDDDDIDEDCDGAADDDDLQGAEGAAGAWLDADGDGYGANEVLTCDPIDTVDVGGDCNDGDPAVSPNAPELCNGIDDDCDGLVDDADPDVTGQGAWFVDTDGDGFGSMVQQAACEPADGLVAAPDDCDDGDPGRNPGAAEIADDGIDQNCSGADLTITYGSGGGCGCQASSSTGSAAAWLWLGLVALARRRGTQAA